MSTFEDHAKILLSIVEPGIKMTCKSCGEVETVADQETADYGLCMSCFIALDEGETEFFTDDPGYCTCEDRPCCGCA